MSTSILPLVEKAKELGATNIIFPGKKVEDDGQYGDERRRFRISVETMLR
jgi:hypothetical protein